MGWFFEMKHANAVAWLTTPPSDRRGWGRETEYDHELAHDLIRGLWIGGGYGLVGGDAWKESVLAVCGGYYERSTEKEVDEVALDTAMHAIREHAAEVHLFALGVAHDERGRDEIRAFFEDAARASGAHGLFLMPRSAAPREWDMQLPVGPVSKLARIDRWPGVLLWSPLGGSFFATPSEARSIFENVRVLLGADPMRVDEVLRMQDHHARRPPTFLHLSDLHFGTERAAETLDVLVDEIDRLHRREGAVRTVVTGDLFDNPHEGQAREFRAFRRQIARLTGAEPIVIPGNHDRRLMGNFRWDLPGLDLEWQRVVVDERLGVVFTCFDSARSGAFASGQVEVDQLRDMAVAVNQLDREQDRVRSYPRVALVHHHPIPFDTAPSAWWERWIERAGGSIERLVKMHDSERFLEWCAHRGVSLVLHGHKHVPFQASARVPVGGTTVRLLSVGCGSSTGVHAPMTVNVVSHHHDRWAVRVLTDPGDGRGFVEQSIQVRDVELAAK